MSTGVENLKIYQLAESLEIYIYKTTEIFSSKVWRIVDQLRRSSASVTDNISESYARFSYQDKINRMYIARGEAEETRRGIIKSFKKDLFLEKDAHYLTDKYTELIKGINGYIKFLYREQEKKRNNAQVPRYLGT